jgi:TonB family protein
MKALLDQRLSCSPLTVNRALIAVALSIGLLSAAGVRAASRGHGGTGSITVRVHDPVFGTVPDASVTLVNLDKNQKTSARTRADGTCEFSAIPAGRYQFEVRAVGFQTFKSLVLELSSSGSIDSYVTLQLGRRLQRMTVTGNSLAGPPPITRKARKPPRICVGGGQGSRLIHSVVPVYPPSEERKGVTGTVVLQVIIGTDGRIVSLSPQSGPDPALIQSAANAVRKWRYTPTYLDCRPVDFPVRVEIIYRLSP